MIALIDGDLVAFRCAASANEDGEEISVLRADKLMRELLEATGAESYRVFLTGTENFRKEIDPQYKANRKDKEPPTYLQQTREFLVREWKAEVQDNIEADDALGINQTDSTIICSLDKDLLQVPGKHYRWAIGTATWSKEAQFLEVGYLDGLKSFYRSTLIGDVSDNIVGVYGLGPKKAAKFIDHLNTEQEMFDVCRELYQDDERFFRNLKLLWIMREDGDIFDPVERGLLVQE